MKNMIVKKIKVYLEKLDNISAAFIYGSFASHVERPASDIDIAILLYEGTLSFQKKNNIILDLNDLTGREVDCVEIDKSFPVLQMQIFKNGKLLFCKDEKQLRDLQVEVIRNYLDLKKNRKPIEDRLKKVSIYD